MIGAWSDADGSLLGGFNEVSYDEDLWALQAGVDFVLAEDDAGRWIGSAFAHYGQIDTDGTNETTGLSAGSVDTTGYGGGVSLTYEGYNGLYVDGVASYTRYDLDEASGDGSTGSTDAKGWAVSGEIGQSIAVSDQFTITPQAQLTWQSIDIDNFTDSSGVAETFSDSDSLEGRLGSNFGYMVNPQTKLYARASLVKEFLDSPVATVAGTPLSLGLDDTGYEVGGGVQWTNVTKTMSLWAEGDYRAAFNGDSLNTWHTTAGISIEF